MKLERIKKRQAEIKKRLIDLNNCKFFCYLEKQELRAEYLALEEMRYTLSGGKISKVPSRKSPSVFWGDILELIERFGSCTPAR
jgi:hypothetical protein